MSAVSDCPLRLLFAFAFFCGCAAPGVTTVQRVDPVQVKADNELFVPTSPDSAWDRVVGQLAKSFYVINNIDKASRLINVSFSSDSPEEYIDCGGTHRTFERGNDKQDYHYAIAASASYRNGRSYNGLPVTDYIDRKTHLDGRANIYIAPKDKGTIVTVNARYILTITVTGKYIAENRLGTPIQSGPLTPSTSTISFSTNEQNRTNIGTASDPLYITCLSRGKLEGDILAYLQTPGVASR